MDACHDAFLSYHSADGPAVEAIALELRARGINVFLDRWYLAPGRPWQQALEEHIASSSTAVVFLGQHGMGSWQQREKDLALDRQMRDREFHVVPVLLPGSEPPLGFLRLNTWIDFRVGADRNALVASLAAAIGGAAPPPAAEDARVSVSPYRGLRYFREEDAPFFFGRDAYVDRLAARLEQSNFVGVFGPSGSGKSSAVRAGLVPRVRRGLGGHVWDVAVMVPGANPFEAFAAALHPLLRSTGDVLTRLGEIAKLADDLFARRISIQLVMKELLALQPGTDRLLFFIDQWEELYTLAPPAQRERFIEVLLEGVRSAPLSVVTTLRNEFFGRVTEDRALSDAMAAEKISIPNEEELRQVVEEPARLVGAELEPGLTARILHGLGESTDNLPLLEFVLAQLWERRRGLMLTHEAYDAIGEVRGAIAAYAERVFARMSDEEQGIARGVFLSLLSISKDTPATKRPVKLAELPPRSEDVARKLVAARLIVTRIGTETGDDRLEITHEALIRHWSRLGGWIAEDAQFLVWRERLRVDLDRWEESSRKSAMLLRGRNLRIAKQWARSHGSRLAATETEYLQRSVRATRWGFGLLIGVFMLPLTAAGTYWLIESRQARNPAISPSTVVVTTAEPAAPRLTYGLLVGRVTDHQRTSGRSRHYQIEVQTTYHGKYRVAVSVRTQMQPDRLLCVIKEPFTHSLLGKLENKQSRFLSLTGPELGIDYVRGGFVTRDEMRPLSSSDLNQKLDMLVQRALIDPNARIYVFGDYFEDSGIDEVFGFIPSQGVRNVHMDQGNARESAKSDDVWQDGALLFRFGNGRWAAVFLAYQTQTWVTDDRTGHARNR